MRRHIFSSPLRSARLCGLVIMFLVVGVLGAILTPPVAAQEPKPDPAGIATGDKNNALDAAGNPFVVSEPTDKSAPDYAERKKNAGHLMMLNFAAYVFAFIAYYAVGYAFQFGAVSINAAPGNLGGIGAPSIWRSHNTCASSWVNSAASLKPIRPIRST